MSAAPKGATHFLIGDGIDNPWRDLSGPTWKFFYGPGGRWVDTEEPSTAFIGRNAYRLQDLRAERDSAVADAAQWLWLNRQVVTPGMLDRAPTASILCAYDMAMRADKAGALDWTVVDADGMVIATPAILEELARLRNPWRTDTPPYDVEVLAEFDMGSGPFKILATYVEQPILSDKPHGKWYDADLRSLTGLKRWMEIPA